MKTIARYLIYMIFMLSAILLMVQPFSVWWETGEVDAAQLLLYSFFSFSLIFAGTEASEELRKRWEHRKDKPGGELRMPQEKSRR